MGIAYSSDLITFAKQVLWFQQGEQVLVNKVFFLVHIMGRAPLDAYEHALQHFFSEQDFIEALRNAPPGIIMYPARWTEWNERLKINPPLPFPRKWQERKLQMMQAH